MELKTHQKDEDVNVIEEECKCDRGRKGTWYYGILYQHPEALQLQQRFKGNEGGNQAKVMWEVL